MSTGTSSSDDDGFAFGESNLSRRYPVHDCCEFEDAESLKRLIFIRQDKSDDDDDSSSSSSGSQSDGDGSSTSDDSNDSHEAAHAAAIGHSPQPIPNFVRGAEAGASAQHTGGNEYAKIENAEGSMEMDTRRRQSPDSAMVPDSAQDKRITLTKEGENSTMESEAKTEKRSRDVSPSSGEAETSVTTAARHQTVQEGHCATNDKTQSPEGSKKTVSALKDERSEPPADGLVAMDVSPEQPPQKTTGSNENKRPMVGNVMKESNGVRNSNAKKKEKRKTAPNQPKKPVFYCPYDLDERDEDENTPLHVAIHSRKLEHVRLLVEAGASVHKKCDGSAPIHTAISIGSVPMHAEYAYDCAALLSENGADLSVRDDAMHTPLYLACMMNLPRIVSYILTKDNSIGMSTLNARSDRSGGRPLHAAAKHDTPVHPRYRNQNKDPTHAHGRGGAVHHHPDGTLDHSGHHVPGFHRVPADMQAAAATTPDGKSQAMRSQDNAALVTQALLSTPGIEVDPKNTYGQTPLHVACSKGNWPVVRLLLRAAADPHVADRRGFTPGQLAHKRGMLIPNDLLPVLGEAPSSCHGAPPRDLIVDPDNTSLIICHELCSLHRSCPPIRRDSNSDPPPENVRRLHVLINEEDGILRGAEFGTCTWEGEARRAAISDVLKVHEYNYVETISQMCSSIPDHPSAIAHLDADTAISRWSFEAAMRAAGSICDAVDRVVAGDYRNAFCAVRPPGHHAGPRGIVQCANDPDGGSHGFCLLNNVAIGAAYARCMYRNHDIRKIAIVDFDVHHGNGTEEVIRQLVPQVEKSIVRTPFAMGELARPSYRPWLDETDVNDVFFASTHGYGPRGIEFVDHAAGAGGWFYPASGKSVTTDAVLNPSVVESPNVADFILSQTWTRMGEESRMNCCKVINCGLGLPSPDSLPGMQRVELRDAYRKSILPHLREFDPDIIFISAGFDAHKRDTMNFGYVGMVEDDYEWVTEQLVKVANTCCNGRIVSVLEGGYKIHGGIVSPFARSVASHVRALVDGGKSRELYDPADCEWDSQFEKHMVEDRERRRQLKLERLNRAAEESQRHLLYGRNPVVHDGSVKGEDELGATESHQDEQPPRKRRRNQVDYKALYEQMKKEEGFPG